MLQKEYTASTCGTRFLIRGNDSNYDIAGRIEIMTQNIIIKSKTRQVICNFLRLIIKLFKQISHAQVF